MAPPPPSRAQASTRRNVIFAFWVCNTRIEPSLTLGCDIPGPSIMVENDKYLQSETPSGAYGPVVGWEGNPFRKGRALKQACKIEFPIPVAVKSVDPAFDLDALIRNAQHHIDDANDFNAHHLRLHNVAGMSIYRSV